jgi:hypothetical protein
MQAKYAQQTTNNILIYSKTKLFENDTQILYFITLFIRSHEQKIHICTWNLYCKIYGVFIFNITHVII